MSQLQPMPLFLNESAGADRGLICGYQLLMVISDFTYEDESDPWEVTPIWCYAGRHLLITGRVHAR